jgi:hypothetical protein
MYFSSCKDIHFVKNQLLLFVDNTTLDLKSKNKNLQSIIKLIYYI